MSQYFTNSTAPALAEDVPAGRVVSLTGSLTGLAADATEAPLGVSAESGNAGDNITVIYLGSVLCDASGSISIGDPVAASADGDGKVYSVAGVATPTGSSGWGVGVAQTAAAGGKVRIFVNPGYTGERS